MIFLLLLIILIGLPKTALGCEMPGGGILIAAKLRSCDGRRALPAQPPLPTALPPLPLQAPRLPPLADAALPLSADDVDIAEDMYWD